MQLHLLLFFLEAGPGVEFEEDDIAVTHDVLTSLLAVFASSLEVKTAEITQSTSATLWSSAIRTWFN